jgi:hypothetical protein
MVLQGWDKSLLNLKLEPISFMTNSIARRLELYTQKCPQEVLLVRAGNRWRTGRNCYFQGIFQFFNAAHSD